MQFISESKFDIHIYYIINYQLHWLRKSDLHSPLSTIKYQLFNYQLDSTVHNINWKCTVQYPPHSAYKDQLHQFKKLDLHNAYSFIHWYGKEKKRKKEQYHSILCSQSLHHDSHLSQEQPNITHTSMQTRNLKGAIRTQHHHTSPTHMKRNQGGGGGE